MCLRCQKGVDNVSTLSTWSSYPHKTSNSNNLKNVSLYLFEKKSVTGIPSQTVFLCFTNEITNTVFLFFGVLLQLPTTKSFHFFRFANSIQHPSQDSAKPQPCNRSVLAILGCIIIRMQSRLHVWLGVWAHRYSVRFVRPPVCLQALTVTICECECCHYYHFNMLHADWLRRFSFFRRLGLKDDHTTARWWIILFNISFGFLFLHLDFVVHLFECLSVCRLGLILVLPFSCDSWLFTFCCLSRKILFLFWLFAICTWFSCYVCWHFAHCCCYYRCILIVPPDFYKFVETFRCLYSIQPVLHMRKLEGSVLGLSVIILLLPPFSTHLCLIPFFLLSEFELCFGKMAIIYVYQQLLIFYVASSENF